MRVDRVPVLGMLHWYGPLERRRLMKHTSRPSARFIPVQDRNRLEFLRFESADAQRQAIQVLLDYGMLNFTSYKDKEWFVLTPVARKLREQGVPFDWLTENV